MLQWFMRFPEFAEFTEFLFHLGKTPMWQGFMRWEAPNGNGLRLVSELIKIEVEYVLSILSHLLQQLAGNLLLQYL